jgi:hypothetical protein
MVEGKPDASELLGFVREELLNEWSGSLPRSSRALLAAEFSYLLGG